MKLSFPSQVVVHPHVRVDCDDPEPGLYQLRVPPVLPESGDGGGAEPVRVEVGEAVVQPGGGQFGRDVQCSGVAEK